ncbi:MAG: 2-oxoacid:acceptor oxidoreductase family protein [bacterium]|nr:2-oxoacid:acceptor oxidoreductase family protein [bacterium]MDT8396661.1 2-oxoacid:acceptor oxidoreductase family protein [bacterium]
MEFNVVAAGIGGQGIVLFSEILAKAMLTDGLNPSFYVHSGLAQLGGSVRSHIRAGERICPKISHGCADAILSLELSEILHAVPYLKRDGRVLVSDVTRMPYHTTMNPSLYPTVDMVREVFTRSGIDPAIVPAGQIARGVGHCQTVNMVMLGALVATTGIVDTETAVKTIRCIINGGEDINVEAFWKGYEFIKGQDYV